MNKVKNILLVQTGFIGDVILSSPVISALKAQYPDSELTLLTTPVAASLYEGHKDLKEIIKFDKRRKQSGIYGLLKMASILRTKSFDVVYSLHKSSRTSLLLYLSGIKERYSFKESKLNFFYTKTAKRSDQSHDVLRNLAIMRVHGIEPEIVASPMTVASREDSVIRAKEILSSLPEGTKIVVAPGSVWATKRAPKEIFLEVIKLCRQEGYSVILLGGPDDMEVSNFIDSGLNEEEKKQYVNIVGKCPLNVSIEVVRLSDLVVSNDSSPLHMASATGKPVVAIFCATVPAQGFGPWMVPYRIVEVLGLDCRPCGRHGGNICPTGTNACQKGIMSVDVLRNIKELISIGS